MIKLKITLNDHTMNKITRQTDHSDKLIDLQCSKIQSPDEMIPLNAMIHLNHLTSSSVRFSLIAKYVL
jgi:hypothetical protein